MSRVEENGNHIEMSDAGEGKEEVVQLNGSGTVLGFRCLGIARRASAVCSPLFYICRVKRRAVGFNVRFAPPTWSAVSFLLELYADAPVVEGYLTGCLAAGSCSS